MNTAALYHKANDNYCFARDENRLVIRLRTGKDVTGAALWYGDPFEWGILGGSEKWCGKRVEMEDVRGLKEHLLWTAEVAPAFKRCRYYFEVSDGKETLFLTENGLISQKELEAGDDGRLDFYFPWMNPADIYTPPSWAADTVWYQIFPDRFCNGNPGNNPAGVREWAGPKTPVENHQIYGGDLEGIEKKLDYLKSLGIGGIYLTPVNESGSTHKYDTTDYYKIDPAFGTASDMKRLVRQAHAKGLRVMLDGVFNHCGRFFPKWRDVQEKGPESKYYHYFCVNEWPFQGDGRDSRRGRYHAFAFADGMPKLNTNNQEVIGELLDICTYWVEEYDIDALRLDVANELSHTFCKELRRRMLALKPDFYIVGEIWHDSMPWLRGDEFDAVMNYPLRQVIGGLGVSPLMVAERFEQEINRCYTMYPTPNNEALFNLLDSHDTIRLRTRLGSGELFALQLAVLFTMTGSACIYYGTEVALEGGHDPDCRRLMPWKEIERGDYEDNIAFVKELIRVRARYMALRRGDCRFLPAPGRKQVIRYLKVMEGETAVEVLLNLSREAYPAENAEGTEEGGRAGKVILSGNYDLERGLLGPLGYLVRESRGKAPLLPHP